MRPSTWPGEFCRASLVLPTVPSSTADVDGEEGGQGQVGKALGAVSDWHTARTQVTVA